jgi:hypothetical protein
LKKRTKKLLRGCRRLLRDSRAKVFASFFKKKRFPHQHTAPVQRTRYDTEPDALVPDTTMSP